MLQLQPRHWRLTPILKAVILLIAIYGGAKSSSDPRKVSNFCTETWYVNKLITNLKERAAASARDVEKSSQNVKLFQFAANRHASDHKSAGYVALAAMVEFENQKVAQQALLFAQTHFDALHKLAHRTGTTALSIAISATATTKLTGMGAVENTGGDHLHADGEAKHCKISQELTIGSKMDCTVDKAKEVEAKAEADKTDAWDKILLRQATELTKIKVETRILTKGSGGDLGTTAAGLTDAPGCNAGAAVTTISGASNAILGGAKSITTTFTSAPINIPQDGSQDSSGPQPPTNTNNIDLLVSDNDLAKALKTAFSQPIPVATDISTLTLSGVLSNSVVKAFSKTLAAKNKGKTTASLSDEDAAAVVFGDKKVDIQTLYIEHLESDEITISSESEIKGTTKKLSENNFANAMAYFYRENQKKLAEASAGAKPEGDAKTDAADKTGEKKDGDNKATAADCTGAEEKDCDKTKCDWNKEKKECKVKEGAAVISAVIKAPLLLAFLLL